MSIFPFPKLNFFDPKPRVASPTPIYKDPYEDIDDRTPALDAYKEHVSNMPNRADYEPGLLSKILGTASVAISNRDNPANAFAQARAMREQPFRDALSMYQMKGSGLGELADIEGRQLNTKIALAKDKSRTQMDWMKMLSDMGVDDARIRNIDSQIKDRDLTVINSNIDGKTYVVSKTDPNQKTELGKFAESVGEKTDREFKDFSNRENNVLQPNRVKLEGVRFGNNKALEGIRQNNRIQLEDKSFGNRKALEGIRFGNENSLLDRKFDHDVEMGDQRHENRLVEIGAQGDETRKSHQFRVNNPENSATQDAAAFKNALDQTILSTPGWAKWIDSETGLPIDPNDVWGNPSDEDLDDYENFVNAVNSNLQKLRPNNAPIRPQVRLPNQSPLNPPDVKNQAPKEVSDLLASKPDGDYTLNDGSSWKKVNGIVTRVK